MLKSEKERKEENKRCAVSHVQKNFAIFINEELSLKINKHSFLPSIFLSVRFRPSFFYSLYPNGSHAAVQRLIDTLIKHNKNNLFIFKKGIIGLL